ncbi:LppU/SCO3897 family protein [Streptomyces sp. NPDC001272]
MSPEPITLTLTPAQAAAGTTVEVPLPSGPARLRIPPTRSGDLIRARVGTEEVLLRIRVSDAPGPPTGGRTAPGPTVPTTPTTPTAPAPSGKPGPLGCLLAVGVVAAIVIGIAVASSSDDDSRPTASATPSSTDSSYTPYTPPTYTYSPPSAPAAVPTHEPPDSTPTTEAAPRPFDEGTCLNGQLPDSTTATRVTGVHEVACSADDAHYRVIQRFPGTSDMSRCDANSDTEYGFSYRYTLGSSVINEYVYCLVGLGSYARG